ncbi:Ada metal-binding domain-containing protein [uncultured Roseivirga sp.]|uniref:Ada metal-binding domain-containing protein n=1 Tax=uncultured Roseivirga sp. TaxID=543088 RepID=UPI0030DD826B
MIYHTEINNSELHGKIRRREIRWAGNRKLKIYGTLNCASGKRMKRENRVFFHSLDQAKLNGFRPCGHCMRTEYLNWKNRIVQ